MKSIFSVNYSLHINYILAVLCCLSAFLIGIDTDGSLKLIMNDDSFKTSLLIMLAISIGTIFPYIPNLLRDSLKCIYRSKFYNFNKLLLFERYLMLLTYLTYNVLMVFSIYNNNNDSDLKQIITFRIYLLSVGYSSCNILSKSIHNNIFTKKNIFIIYFLFSIHVLSIYFVNNFIFKYCITLFLSSIFSIYLLIRYIQLINIKNIFSDNIEFMNELPTILTLVTNIINDIVIVILLCLNNNVRFQNCNINKLLSMILFQYIRFSVTMYTYSLVPRLINDINVIALDTIKQMKTETDHEMRTPLMIAKESLSYIISSLLPELHKVKNNTNSVIIDSLIEYIDDTFESVEISITQITKQADYRKLLYKEQTYELNDSNICNIIRKVFNSFAQTAASQNINMSLLFSENNGIKYEINNFNKNIIINTDSDKFRIIITNIISNSIKFSGKNAKRTNGEISININTYFKNNKNSKLSSIIASDIESNPIPNMVSICIKDNGIGMTDENLKKLGNDGFQIKPENQAGGGSGYGIGIIKRHIKNLNGNLTISSELNKGTTFIVTFPIVRLEDTCDNDMSSNNTPIIELRKQMEIRQPKNFNKDEIKRTTVLIVDDAPLILKVTKRKFEGYGWVVDTLNDGNEVIKIIKNDYSTFSNKYDIIFLDNQMKIINGPQVANELRKIGYNKPIFGLTGNVERNLKIDFKANGVNEIISKPFTEDFFFETLDKHDANYHVYENATSSTILRSNNKKYENVKYEYNSKIKAWNHFIEKNNKWESNLEFYVNKDGELDVKNCT